MPKDDHPPAFLLYPQDFASDSKVEAMTTREVGAYFLLLCKAWYETPVATIPNNDRVLARWARLTPDEWAECRDAVLSPFKACADNRLLSPRLSSEYRKLMESRRKKSLAGKSGAEKRWQCHNDGIAPPMRPHASANTKAMPKDAISSSISKDPPPPARARVGEEGEDIPAALLALAREVYGLTPEAVLTGWMRVQKYPADWIEKATLRVTEKGMRGAKAIAYAAGILRDYARNGGADDDEPAKANGRSTANRGQRQRRLDQHSVEDVLEARRRGRAAARGVGGQDNGGDRRPDTVPPPQDG